MKLIEQSKTTSSKREYKRYAKATRKSPEKKKIRKMIWKSQANCKDLEESAEQGAKLFGVDNIQINKDKCSIIDKETGLVTINSKKDSKKYADKILKKKDTSECKIKGIKTDLKYNPFEKKSVYTASIVYGKKDDPQYIAIHKEFYDLIESKANTTKGCKCSDSNVIFETEKNYISVPKKEIEIKKKEIISMNEYKALSKLERRDLSTISNLSKEEPKEQHILKIMHDKAKNKK